MNDYQRKLVADLRRLPLEEPPSLWRILPFVMVGGLEAVGFGEASDLLLIVSDSGRSVLDCRTGNRLSRDYTLTSEDWTAATWYRYHELLAEGIGPLDGQMIRLAGIHGGGLSTITRDGWSLELVAPDWPNSFVLLHSPLFINQQRVRQAGIKVAPTYPAGDVVLTYGFSPTGNSFVVAYSHGAEVFARVSE